MSTPKLPTKPINRRIRKISRTESEGSGGEGEGCRLTSGGGVEGAGGGGDAEEALSYCEVHDVPPPPDGGFGWVIVFASFVCNLIVDGIAYTFGIFQQSLVEYYGEGKGKTAWVGSLLAGMYLLAGPLVSALTNKFGCRAVCIAGSIIGCIAFVLSTFSPNVTVLMITYGIMGGFGFGLIYLPAVVCVGYYFETKRSLATGIAVCGSGVGTFLFAPLATYLLDKFEWQGANLILAGLILNCAVFGAMMRPLEFPKGPNCKPLLQRMADEKRFQMERGSIGGSYFIVQLPDGSMEKRMKMPINIDPGVHSSFNLNELVPGTPLTPVPTMPVLPTISEAKAPGEQSSSSGESSSAGSNTDVKKDSQKEPLEEKPERKVEIVPRPLPRNQSQPAFSTGIPGLPKNGSVPFFDRIRKTSQGERFKPTLQAIRVSRPNMNSNGDVRKSLHLRLSTNSVTGSRNNNMCEDMWSKTDVDNESVCFTMSKMSISKSRKELIRPMSRKDIFYSGSIVNLPEYQSQRSLTGYRQSVISLPRYQRGPDGEMLERPELCPCFTLPDSFKSALAAMLDWTLLKDPVFLMIGISNLFGMAGLYVPFVYLVDAAVDKGVDKDQASFLISVIGITNTIGRIACGFLADLPWVNSLFLNNISLVVATVSVGLIPLCSNSYEAYVAAAIFFGLAISAYISLTSIILVDLLGLDKLTNAFGLLILFRGVAAIVGSPLAGAIYDATHTYDIPFYVASGLFLVSTVTSFLTPVMRSCSSAEPMPPIDDEDGLTPIDEEDDENEDMNGEDEERPDVPEIVETAASPIKPDQVTLEIKQIESVL